MRQKLVLIIMVLVTFALIMNWSSLPQIVVRINGQNSILDDVIPVFAEHDFAYWDTHCQNKYWWQPFDPVQLLYFEVCEDDGVTVQTASLQLVHWRFEPTEPEHPWPVWGVMIDGAFIWR